MFGCKMCSENPFAFGAQPMQQERQRHPKQAKASNQRQSRKSKLASRKIDTTFQARSEAEIRECVKQWQEFVHPRAHQVFSTPELLQDVLVQLARFTDKNHDPLLGNGSMCAVWHGEITGETEHAAIKTKGNKGAETVTFANRVMAFIFAADDSFEELMKLPKKGFDMSCDNNLCINLVHISF